VTTWHAADQAFSTREFRDALGCFATGVTLITTQGADHAYGMTANAFSSVSLEPPLVLVCVVNGTEGGRRIRENGCFAVNVLGHHQEALSRYFASSDRPRGAEMFDSIPHSRVATGSPVIDGIASYFDCRLVATHEAGDHIIFIGEVVALGANHQMPPLLFHQGRYAQMAQQEVEPGGEERDSPTA